MATSYSHFKVNRFPSLSKKHPGLITTIGDNHLQGKPEQTKVTFKVKDIYGSFERYEVYHEYLRTAHGRTYDGRDFENFYQKNTFDAFLDRSNSLFICNAPRRAARSFVDTLNKNRSEMFNFDYLKVDFSIVKNRTRDVRGIWFSDMGQPFLQSAGFFGPHVEKSEFCRQAQAAGDASAYLIFHGYGERAFPINLSSHCSITFLTADPEELHFDIIRHIHKNLLKDAVSSEDSAHNGKKKRQELAAVAKADREAAERASKITSPDSDGHPKLFKN